MVFSTRDQSLSRNLFPYINEKWRWVNFVFGGADFQTARTEFEIIDLFWFFGFLGGIIYVFLIHKTFIKNIELRTPLLFLLFITLLAGSFFTNAPVMPYVVFLFFYLKQIHYQKAFYK